MRNQWTHGTVVQRPLSRSVSARCAPWRHVPQIKRGVSQLLLGPLLAAGILFSAPAPAQQTLSQQRCSTALGRSLQLVANAHLMEARACHRDGAAGVLGSLTVDQCTTADRRGKVSNATAKAARRFDRQCTGLDRIGQPRLPGFGATDDTTVTSAAVDLSEGLFHGVLGRDPDPATLAAAADRRTFACQAAVAKAVQRCQEQKLNTFRRCKRNALRGVGTTPAATSQELQDACLGSGATAMPDPRGRIAKACDPALGRVASTILDKCVAHGVDLSDAFPGCGEAVASPDNPLQLARCLAQMAECQTCLAINRADRLNRDCSLMDDGVDDGSCNSPYPDPVEITVTTSQKIYQIGETVQATVDIMASFDFVSALSVVAFSPDDSGAPATYLLQETIGVSSSPAATTRVPLQFLASAPGSYLLLAQLPTDVATAYGRTQFGVRPASLAQLPPEILDAEVLSLDVPSLRSTLELGASSGEPVTIQLGARQFPVRIQPRTIFEPGYVPPASLAGVKFFGGELAGACVGGLGDGLPCTPCDVGAACVCEELGGSCQGAAGSAVFFTVGPDSPSNPAANDLNGMIKTASSGVFWVEPASKYDALAASTDHLLYRSADVFVAPFEFEPLDMGVNVAIQIPPGRLKPVCSLSGTIVKLRVYEHSRGERTTRARVDIVGRWAEQVKREFRNVIPRCDPASSTNPITVTDVWITDWHEISADGYDVEAACVAMRKKFIADREHKRCKHYLYGWGERCQANEDCEGDLWNCSYHEDPLCFGGPNDGGACSSSFDCPGGECLGVPFRNYILFTARGKGRREDGGCQGIAGRMSVGSLLNFAGGISLVRDTLPGKEWDAILLAHEVGHTWDWHAPGDLRHDTHLAPSIGESWTHVHALFPFPLFPHPHCTVMRSGYQKDCTYTNGPELRYHRKRDEVVPHFAEGIRRLHGQCGGPECQ